MRVPDRVRPSQAGGRLVRVVLAAAALLGLGTATLYAAHGPGRAVTPLPWVNALGLTFQMVSALGASVLALGRNRVMRDPVSYWVGVAFWTSPVPLLLYGLAWPGLRPDGSSLLAVLPGTAPWLRLLAAVVLGSLLLAAAVAPWPGRRALRKGRWRASLLGWLAAIGVLCAVVIAFERRLPLLVGGDGRFTPLMTVLQMMVVAMFAAGTVLAARRAWRTGDALLGLVALLQLSCAFAGLWLLLGPVRYGLWWYLARAALAAGALGVLIGMLSEHVALLHSEREKRLRLRQAHDRLRLEQRRRNEFLAMLSHELRNPLATISNAVAVLQLRRSEDPGLRRTCDAAVRQVAQMSTLLDGLLDASRITHGTITLKTQRIDLCTLVERAVEAVQPAIHQKGQRLSLSLPEPGICLEVDPARAMQAIVNVLDNAAKFTPRDGRIEVSAGTEGGCAEVRVRDDGAGIAPAALPHVFDMFFQADRSLQRPHSGLGIGLTVARSLLRLQGGEVEVRSDGPGRGTAVVIRLPLAAA